MLSAESVPENASSKTASSQNDLPKLPHGYCFRQGSPSDLQSFYAESPERWLYLAAVVGVLLGLVWPAFVLSVGWLRSLQQLAFVGPFSGAIIPALSVLAALPLIAAVLLVGGVVLNYVSVQNERSQLTKSGAKSGLIWTVERSHQFVGIAWLTPRKSELALSLLFIHPSHRNRGVGSRLLWKTLTDPRLAKYQRRGVHPLISVSSSSHLKRFYQRFGFKSTDLKSTRHAQKIPLYLATQPSFAASDPHLWPAGSLIRPVRSYRERWAIYKMFWHRQKFRQSVMLLVSVSLISLFLCGVLSAFLGWLVAPVAAKITNESVLSGLQSAFGSNLKLMLFIIPLTIVSAISFAQTVLFKVFFLKITVGMVVLWLSLLIVVLVRNLSGWRDWVIIHNHKAVGYLHVERHSDHSVLHCLHVEPTHFRHLFHARALLHIQPSIGLPLYVACLEQSAYLYKKLGFTPAKKIETLPLGVKILSRFRTRLLKLTAPELEIISRAVTTNSQ